MTSTIKVNTVKDTASTDIIKKCGTSITVGTASDTTTVAGNAVRSNAIQASDGQNIISQVGATITLGATGDNIVLAGGATQSGFGRTGTVDWQTTPKTATFTAVNGEGYFCNTTSGTFEVDLPAGVAGAIVSIQDYNNTFDSNNLTVDPNGSEKINGGTAGGFVTLSTEGLGLTFVYIDATVGWRSIQSNEYKTSGTNATFISATGGTITCSGNFKIHTFTGPGTFCVASLGNACGGPNSMDYVISAGGGGGGSGGFGEGGGGGGGGGYRESPGTATCYTASPLGASPATAITATVQGYPIVVGGGGSGAVGPGGCGVASSGFGLTAAGGGGGGGHFSAPTSRPGKTGGSGGAGAGGASGAAGNTPPVSPAQGTAGGNGVSAPQYQAGGGGGATDTGDNGGPGGSPAGDGGTGATSEITGSPLARSGGGGGSNGQAPGLQGTSPCGSGGAGAATQASNGSNGATNRGGGGGGGGGNNPPVGQGGNGGGGVVVIRYRVR